MKRYVLVVHMYDSRTVEVFDTLDNVQASFDITWGEASNKPIVNWADVVAGADILYNGARVGMVSTREVYEQPIHF